MTDQPGPDQLRSDQPGADAAPPAAAAASAPTPGEWRLSREDRAALARFLAENLSGRVALDVWTRKESGLLVPGRDPCSYCEEVPRVVRQIASLHPALSVTLYDMDRHAARAAEAGIERAPTTVIRSTGSSTGGGTRGGPVHFTGMFSGPLLTSFIDGVVIAGAGAAPFEASSLRILDELQSEHSIEAYVAPYDPGSAMQLQLLLALGAVSPLLRVRVIEAAEFPQLAAARGVTELPLVVVDGHRERGLWTEAELLERLRRLDVGDDEPVIREQVLAVPYLSLEEVLREQQGGQPPGPPRPPARPGSGLIVPGR